MSTLAERESANPVPECGELDLYRIFAYALGLPAAAKFAWLSREDVQSALDSLSEELDVRRPHGEGRRFADPTAYEAAYLALFEVGMPEPAVPLLESAHHRGVPAQQIVLDCVNFYSVLGLRHEGSAYPADHLVTQLEFLSAVQFLRESSADALKQAELMRLECDFIERHLIGWLPVAQSRLERLNPPLFPFLLRLVHAFLRRQLASLPAGEPL